MLSQLLGTAVGTKCAPPYACLTVGYLEEIKVFTNKLPKYFNENECKLITKLFTLYGWCFYLLAIKVKLWKL